MIPAARAFEKIGAELPRPASGDRVHASRTAEARGLRHSPPLRGTPARRFVAALDSVAASPLVRIPLAITGKWVRGSSEFSITLADLEEIVRNFNERQNGEINVDYDHASEMPEVAAGGPIPSAGRLVKIDPPERFGSSEFLIRGSTTETRTPSPGSRYILYGWYEPTERARQLIQNREYRYISPALDWSARHKRTGKPQGATLSTVALTNRPFLEELPPLQLSDPTYRLVEADDARADTSLPQSQERNQTGGSMKKAKLSVADGKVKITHEDLPDEYYADPEELKQCLEALGLLPDSSAVSALSLGEARALLSEGEASGKSISALEFFRAEVERELDHAVRSGKILPRRRDDWRKIALSDFTAFRKILAEQKPQVPLQPVGFSGGVPQGVQTQVKLLVEQRMRERQMSFGQALTEIGREQPELMQEYRRAVSGTE